MKINHRTFTFDDQKAFAKLSGDYNPLHLDKALSRRLLFGSPVVHGIHSLLWSLDSWLDKKKEIVELQSIKAFFLKPLNVGKEVSLSLNSERDKHITMELKSDGGILTKIEFEWEKSEKQNLDLLNIQFPRKVLPRIVPADEMEDKSGNLNLYLNIESSSKMFPNLLEYFSPLQISIILSTSRLVGIKCPGLYSIYTELNLSFCAVNECTTLEYGVEKFNKRFGKVFISLLAPGSEGFIQAFIRPKEREQSNFLEIKKKVNEDEFRYQSALIIGGSRGLGEVTVKLLAAGSADVKLTYHQGEEDANRIVKEINSNGGTANCFQYDVLSPDQDSFYNALNDWRPTHLYYFATPFIFSGTKGIFSDILFKKFCDYYISGFINIINMLRPLELRNIFYPSSIAIDELPSNMGEYVSAKIAGEMLCMFFEQNYNDITIYRPRLPRMDTDQTVSLFPVKNEDPVPIQLEHLRLLNSGSDLK